MSEEQEKLLLEQIRLTNFDEETTDIFQEEFEKYFGELIEQDDQVKEIEESKEQNESESDVGNSDLAKQET